VVCLGVLWHFRYTLSVRDLAEMFLQRGIIVTHEAVREAVMKGHAVTPLLTLNDRDLARSSGITVMHSSQVTV
jgi:putative transposase